MPLTKRSVSPVQVSTNRIPATVRHGELECVSNGTLANLIRQLSSLSRHAEDMMGELFHEAVKLEHKTNTLLARVDRLNLKVTQLDSNVEEVSLKDLHLRKAFKSSSLIDQHSLSRQTLPTAMGEAYLRCDAPPELNQLNPYRDPGSEPGLKLYTDPEFFFRLWRQEMLRDGESAKKSRQPGGPAGAGPGGGQGKAKRNKQKANPGPQLNRHRGEEFVRELGPYQAPQLAGNLVYGTQPPPGMVRPEQLQSSSSGYSSAGPYAHPNGSLPHQQGHPAPMVNIRDQPAPSHQYQQQHHMRQMAPAVTSQYMAPQQQRGMTPTSPDSPRRPSQPPPAPPPMPQYQYHQNGDLPDSLNTLSLSNGQREPRSLSPDLPPPPPPLSMDTAGEAHHAPPHPPAPPPAPPPEPPGAPRGNIPPPPPPPPPPANLNGGAPTLKDELAKRAAERAANPNSFNVVEPPKKSTAAVSDNSALLQAIREGITLKKVERQEEKAKEKEALDKGNDVAAILRKRMEDVMGTSDSDERSEFNDDDDWDE